MPPILFTDRVHFLIHGETSFYDFMILPQISEGDVLGC